MEGGIPDAGAAEKGPRSSEGDDLRRRLAALEQELAAARDQRAEVERLNAQVAELRQRVADVEERRAAERQEILASRAQAQQAVGTLYAAQQALASGNTDIADSLATVATALPPPAQREIEAARAALAERDLYAARSHIAAAIAATESRGR